MKIFSKYKDYYDSAASAGIDETIRFNREMSVIQLTDVPIKIPRSIDITIKKNPTDPYTTTRPLFPVIVGFCGKTYVVWTYDLSPHALNDSENWKNDFKSWCMFYGDDVYEFINKFAGEKSLRRFKTERRQGKEKFDEFMATWHNKENHDMFIKYGVPTFLIHNITFQWWKTTTECELVLNPILSLVQFYKIFDSFQAFQQISSYISGVLGTKESNSTPMTDKEKVISHGFDIKTSFRKL